MNCWFKCIFIIRRLKKNVNTKKEYFINIKKCGYITHISYLSNCFLNSDIEPFIPMPIASKFQSPLEFLIKSAK